ncbi:hypothetical protein Tco_0747841 [Tanacetum coccineum]|uniref:Uncharacterized protein n=1 Tax=Tanacetum coccineum TaxID=301880 RepID=A0ABQ4YU59_9ASTR
MDSVKLRILAPSRYAIDVEPIPPRNRNNREVHLDYLKHLKKSVKTLREIVKEAKVERPLDSSLHLLAFTLNTPRNFLREVSTFLFLVFDEVLRLLLVVSSSYADSDGGEGGLKISFPLFLVVDDECGLDFFPLSRVKSLDLPSDVLEVFCNEGQTFLAFAYLSEPVLH